MSLRVPAMAQWINDLAHLSGIASSIPSPAQWVKDPLLLPPWCTLQIQFGFSPWPVIFYVAQVQPEKKNL